ncbi:MAG TPA: hypothetical protein VFF86_06220 [Candidatus Methylomirabilis sp.]|nr:hypothetical protein [Candidatus Methylomirabilis sp.]
MGSTPSKVERVLAYISQLSPKERKQLLDRLPDVLPSLPKGERWYWSEAWQKKVRNAHRDLAAGRVKRYRNVDALRRDLGNS